MSRSVPWRRTVTDTVSWRQDQAERATMYILRNVGPTGFLLQEDGERKKHKVFLGDPHTCTCQTFKKDKDLCPHICWVLLKKFRVPRQNPVSFQKGLVEREINEILRGITQHEDGRRRGQGFNAAKRAEKNSSGGTEVGPDGKTQLEQRPITEDDVCPICQDELLEKHEPVTYCRYGCAKSIHIKCMKVWAEHQKSSGETTILCPLCRENFGPIQSLQEEFRNSSVRKTRAERLDLHLGSVCKRCRMSPIQGKCYRCTNCVDYCLCQGCFTTSVHMEHSFLFRQRANQRWRPAERGSGATLPSAVVSDLQNRDITENDYDVLLQLDGQEGGTTDTLPESMVQALPTMTVRQGSLLLSPGAQCRICLRVYTAGQIVKKLPCRHEFHSSCINQWLLHQRGTCPVDGTNMYNAIRTVLENARIARQRQQAAIAASNATNRQEETGNTLQLEIPGIGIATRRGSLPNGRVLRGGDGNTGSTSNGEGFQSTFALTGSSYGSRQPQRGQELVRSDSISSLTSLRRRERTPPRNGGDAGTPPRSRESTRTNLRNGIVNTSSQRQDTQTLTRYRQENRVQNGDRVPVPPSIPLPHTSDIAPLIDDFLRVSDRITNRETQPRGRIHHQVHIPQADNHESVPSIPIPREEIMTPIQGRQSNSASSTVHGRPPLPNENNSPSGSSRGNEVSRDRGRTRNRVQTQIRRRSNSGGRLGSMERPSSAVRLEFLENLFLGSGGAGVVLEHNRSSKNKKRAKKPERTVPRNTNTANTETSDIVLSGSALTTMTISNQDG
ncbi:E3 ubiquitin-protein ligase Zswim2-like [Glandiceps talaboti]